MKRTLVALLVSLVVLPAVAGCLGGDDAPKATDDETCGDQCKLEGEVKEGLGKITGKIIDDAFNPISKANVTLRELELTTKTDDQGRFAFNDLEPATYTVFAQNPPTHKANGKQIEVKPTEVTEADIILELLPPPSEPYFVEDDIVGLIGCSVAYQIIQGSDLCGKGVGGVSGNPNAKTVFDFPLDSGLTTFFLTVTTESASLTGEQELSVAFSKPVGIPGTTGKTPLAGKWEFTEENAWPSWQNKDQTMTIDIRASHEASQPQVAYEQQIHLWLAFFYNGYPAPDGYDPVQDG